MLRSLRMASTVLYGIGVTAMVVTLLTPKSVMIGSTGFGVGLVTLPVLVIAVLSALATDRLRSRYFTRGGRRGALAGTESIVSDAVLNFDPIAIDSGIWRITVTASAGELEAELFDADTGKPVAAPIRSAAERSGRNGPILTQRFWTEESTPRIRLRLRIRLRYHPPVEVRSFRLPVKHHGQPIQVRWSMAIEGHCDVREFPGLPTRQEIALGFPVVVDERG